MIFIKHLDFLYALANENRAALNTGEQVSRDDMESAGYMLRSGIVES